MTTRPVRIFVSSTSKDLWELHGQVVQNLRGSYGEAVEVVTMRDFTAGPEPAQVGEVAKVATCDAFVLLLGWRYGTIPKGFEISHCALEFKAAQDAKLICLVFEADAERFPPIPGKTTDDGADWAIGLGKVNALKARAKEVAQVTWFGPDDIQAKVNQAVREHVLPKFPSLEPTRHAHDHLPALVADDRAATYRTAVVTEHQSLQLVGFPRNVRVPIRLDDLYVALKAVPDLRMSGDPMANGLAARADEELRRFETDVPLSHAFPTADRYGNRRGVAVLGDPGSGKTTQLRRMALACAKSDDAYGPKHLGLPDDVLPVFLSLRRLLPEDDLDHDLAPLLVRSHETRIDPALARWVLQERGRLVYLIDGLDEVPADRRADVSRWIERLRRANTNSFLAVTSRYAGYTKDVRLDEHFLEMHLRPLEDEQIDQFIRNWNEIVRRALTPDEPASKAEAAANDLIERLRKQRRASLRMNEFASNPLLLTNICLVHRDRGRVLPEARAALYEDCLTVLLERWRAAKELPVQWTVERAKQLLQPVALHLHQTNKTRARAEDLCPVLEPLLADVGWNQSAARFLELVRDDSGLLTGWSGDEYGFLHLGFQEYLGALELARLATDAAFARQDIAQALDPVVRSFGTPWWEEVQLLLLAAEGTRLFRPFFDRVVESASFGKHEALVLDACRESSKTSTAPFRRVLDGTKPQHLKPAEWQANQAVARAALLELGPAPAEARQASPSRGDHAGGNRFVQQPTGIELVRIPAGTFWQGADERRRVWTWESPRHEVTLQEFWIATTPITNEQYRRFVEDKGARAPESWKQRDLNQPDQPVVDVSWLEATAFCEWAGLRLPSESEWEFACRAGSDTHYWSGDAESDLERVGWYGRNSDGHPQPVGKKPANPHGLFDTHGNVWEWCRDETEGDPNSTTDYEKAPREGSPLFGTGAVSRVVRGGSWFDHAGFCRSAFRAGFHRAHRGDDVGFRPASSSPVDFTTSPR